MVFALLLGPLSLASDLVSNERAKDSFQSSSSVTVAVISRIITLTGSADVHNIPYAANAAMILLLVEPFPGCLVIGILGTSTLLQ